MGPALRQQTASRTREHPDRNAGMAKLKMKSLFHEALLGAAVTGLMASGCASEDTTSDAPRAIGEIRDATLTVAKFKELCEERNGITQVHAACSGTNACRGLIYHSWAGDLIVEHTCRGFNSCLGISCVYTPEDSGKSGQTVYEESCVSCHGGGEDAENANLIYTVFYEPGGDPVAARATFEATSDATLVNKVAFGAFGYLEDGTAYANMPAYHDKLSLAEIRRAVEYLNGLELRISEEELLGVNAEIDPTGGGE